MVQLFSNIKIIKHSLFILPLLISANSFASDINVVTDKPLFQFEVGLHANYLNAEDYYQLNTSEVFDTDSDTQLGLDVSIQLHHQVLPQNAFLALGWSKTDEYSADVLAHCGNQSCQETTKLNFESLQLNYHYQWHQSPTMESSVYAGVSYVWAEGEIKGQAWRDGATGFQVGNQIYLLPHSAIQPYIGVKLSYFAIEDGDDTIHLPNLSLLFGLRF
ncbi:hypothetical protein P4S54_02865 [Shewanella sp. PP-He15 brown]